MTLDTPNAAKAQIGPIPFFVLPIMLAVLQLAMLNLRAIATARKSVTADEYGLHLGPTLLRRRREDIPWSSARSLVKLDLRNSTMLRPSPMYLLDAGDAIFTWGDSFLKYGAYADPKPGLEIARLIVTRTGLPLRDGTATAFTVAHLLGGAIGGVSPRRIARKLALGHNLPTAADVLARRGIVPPARERRHRRLRHLALLPIVCLVLLYAAAAVVLWRHAHAQ